MIKITDYIYIFSKLTTSLVLFLVIIIMGYTLFKSYNGIDQKNTAIKDYINLLSDKVLLNSNDLKGIKTNLKFNKDQTEKIKLLISKNNQNDLTKQVDKLFAINKALSDKIDKIYLINQKGNKSADIDYSNKNKGDLLNIILLKYKNAEDITEEIDLLEKSLSPQNSAVFEKINLLKLNRFYGFKNLNELFEKSYIIFIKENFLKKNQGSVMNFLSRFITIKPSNLSVYEDEELNILMSAKKYMEVDDIGKSLEYILLLDGSEIIFSDWVSQVKNFLEFESSLEQII